MAPAFEPAPDSLNFQSEVYEEHADLLIGLRSCPKTIPCSYLYDAAGSALYDQIVELPEYYPYRTELSMLNQHMPSIIDHIAPGSVVVELGCGSATKTSLIINALLERDGPDQCFYEGIDCSADFLQLARQNLVEACPKLQPAKVGTICQLYMDGLREARSRHPGQVLCILWLGSSVGNLDPSEASDFFKDVLAIGGASTQVLLCTDLWKDATVLHAAYCDSRGVTEAFIKNGLKCALGAVSAGSQAQGWTYDVVVNAELQQVEMWLVAPSDMYLEKAGVHVTQGERVLMETSRKFTQMRLRAMAFKSGWCWQAAWSNAKYSMQMLYAPELAFQSCWADTDALFAAMPDWGQQPIQIRHPFCFYYGHVAAFAKLKALPQDAVSKLDEMFSRGIDPDVLNPSQCHAHPDAPKQWPTKQEILFYSRQVRQVLQEAMRADRADMRGIYLALEHERMHQETLSYMQAQQRKRSFEAQLGQPAAANSQQPSANGHTFNGVSTKGHAANGTAANGIVANGHAVNGHAANGDAANRHAANGHAADKTANTPGNGHVATAMNAPSSQKHAANGHAVHGNGTKYCFCNGVSKQGSGEESSMQLQLCPAGEVNLGVDTDESACGFVWDNEGPKQAPVTVPAFKAAAGPVTVAQFRQFVVEQHGYDRAELWSAEDFKHFKQAGQRWPATWTVQGKEVWVHDSTASRHWTAVRDAPVWVSLAEAQAFCRAYGMRIMREPEYARLTDHSACSDIGPGWRALRGEGWEWTSTGFKGLPGFQPMQDYPEYSVDFYDGKHFVLKGSAPVTHASIVRDSFRNFYQRQYPFMFAKFRCCRGVSEE